MSFKLYPVTRTALSCRDYAVTVEGAPAALDTARVSAIPFNRRWPGHQRDMAQTELVNFLSLATDGPVTFTVTPQDPFDPAAVVVRPRSLGITPTVSGGTITFTLPRPAYFTVEPWGRSRALHIFADPMPCYGPMENVLYYGPGEHDVGDIELQSGQTLFLDEGAVVYARVHAIDAENIRILGRGILDGSRSHAEILFEHNAVGNNAAVQNAIRRRPLQLEYCTNVQIEGITIRDSLVYTIHPRACRNLHIANVKIIGNWRYNSDGIDMHNCRDVLIENCFLRTFDDCICVKGFDCFYSGDIDKAVYEAMHRNGQVYDTFQNVTVRGCTLWNDWGKCLEIGAETRAEEISGVVFENCDIIHAMHPVLDCCNMDYADIHDVTYRDINVEFEDLVPKPLIQKSDDHTYESDERDYAPPLIKVCIQYHHEYSAGGQRRGRCHHIKFQNIRLYSRQAPKLRFEGYDEQHLVEEITVENLFWNGRLIRSFRDTDYAANPYTWHISCVANDYSQLDKNTVAADNQLHGAGPVRFLNPRGKGKKVLVIGNSMLLHGVNEDLGWHLECGMAASKPENDYVHRLLTKLDDPRICICQVSGWERQYKTGHELLPRFQEARDFGAEVIVMRAIENCPKQDFDPEVFKDQLKALLDYVNPTGTARLILTTGFWRHPGDEAIRSLYREFACVGDDAGIGPYTALVELGDLGEQDEMKAIGLFAHKGVANHPGDLGMEAIATRIAGAIDN